jgi:hypothetical protein
MKAPSKYAQLRKKLEEPGEKEDKKENKKFETREDKLEKKS